MPLTKTQITAAIRIRFQTLIETGHSYPVAYDNAPFTIPESGTWLRLNVRFVRSTLEEIGGAKRHRHHYLMMVQIFTAINKGTAASDTVLDQIDAAFQSQSPTGEVTYRQAGTPTSRQDGKWWMTSIAIPCHGDDIQ